MSLRTPPTLQKLARQALLRDEALAMSSLEELPLELFPALFKEALYGRHTMLMKTMVAAWPFPCLPVGALMVTPDLETLKAVLDEVGMRLTREFHPRRCLRKPLETLSNTHYQISQSDLDSFSCSQRLFQLKHLDMRGIILLLLDITPLKVLLENLADTLQSLDLKGCRMSDSQLTVLIPALSHCSKIKKDSLYNNNFSMPILRDLLKHTANLNKLNVEQYPAPLECYDDLGDLSTELLVQHCAELVDILMAVRQPKSISFASGVCV
ncbi:PRAME family member 8-like [Arvicanthis niloticus]|uniref:PRAME family member 8-like n=1 Tax=Arvicanthis niloticus TaxID=61156 RepID=UPI001485EA7D|nr:oogenesin-3-like [Arvicanthis niloticus]